MAGRACWKHSCTTAGPHSLMICMNSSVQLGTSDLDGDASSGSVVWSAKRGCLLASAMTQGLPGKRSGGREMSAL